MTREGALAGKRRDDRGARPRLRASHALFAFALLLVVLVAAVAAFIVLHSRERRLAEAERALEGRKAGPDIFTAAADAAAAAVDAMDDSNYSADYRRDLVKTVTYRALEGAA